MKSRRAKTVYFIVCNSRIKIGYTANMKQRMSQYRDKFRDVEILGTVPGDFKRERQIQITFVRHREAGEWFFDTPELRSAIMSLIENEPPPPAPPPEEFGPFLNFLQRPELEKRNDARMRAPLDAHHRYMDTLQHDLAALPREMRRMVRDAELLLVGQHFSRVIQKVHEGDDFDTDRFHSDMGAEISRVQLFAENIIVCSQEQSRREAA